MWKQNHQLVKKKKLKKNCQTKLGGGGGGTTTPKLKEIKRRRPADRFGTETGKLQNEQSGTEGRRDVKKAIPACHRAQIPLTARCRGRRALLICILPSQNAA